MKFKLVLIAGALVTAFTVVGTVPASPARAKATTVYKTMIMVGHVLGQKAPDGLQHDTTYGASFSVEKGQRVIVTVYNWDEGPHTITAAGLKLNVKIPGAINEEKGVPSKTTFSFTATKVGKFRWFCALPCDARQNYWAMKPSKGGVGQEGYMAGYVSVTA